MGDESDKTNIAVLTERQSSDRERIKKLEDNQRWIVLLVLGAVVMGVLKGVLL